MSYTKPGITCLSLGMLVPDDDTNNLQRTCPPGCAGTWQPSPDELGSPREALSEVDEPIAFGAKVSSKFKERVVKISEHLGIYPGHLMAAMAFESGGTFSSSVANAAGSGAVGLLQFMPSTARNLGTSTNELAAMSPVDQLDYVEAYFAPYRGKLKSMEDLYMAILWPAAIGKPNDYVLFDRDDKQHPKRYEQNRGLDKNRDGKVTKAEAAAAVREKLQTGLKPGYMG